MSGITLRQMLMSINMYESVRIEDEFALNFIQLSVWEMLQTLTNAQLSQKFDYVRTVEGHITIGMSGEIYNEYF